MARLGRGRPQRGELLRGKPSATDTGTGSNSLGAITSTAGSGRTVVGAAADVPQDDVPTSDVPGDGPGNHLGALTLRAQQHGGGTATSPLGGLTLAAHGIRATTGSGTAALGRIVAATAGATPGHGVAAAPLGGLRCTAVAAGVEVQPVAVGVWAELVGGAERPLLLLGVAYGGALVPAGVAVLDTVTPGGTTGGGPVDTFTDTFTDTF